MAGGIVMVLILLVLPVIIIMSMAVVAGALGWLLKDDVDEEFEGTEYLELG